MAYMRTGLGLSIANLAKVAANASSLVRPVMAAAAPVESSTAIITPPAPPQGMSTTTKVAIGVGGLAALLVGYKLLKK